MISYIYIYIYMVTCWCNSCKERVIKLEIKNSISTLMNIFFYCSSKLVERRSSYSRFIEKLNLCELNLWRVESISLVRCGINQLSSVFFFFFFFSFLLDQNNTIIYNSMIHLQRFSSFIFKNNIKYFLFKILCSRLKVLSYCEVWTQVFFFFFKTWTQVIDIH